MFNVRVYGVLINNCNGILVSDEIIRGTFVTKFCGGGLEFGEGTRDCLKREFMEEMQLPVTVMEHIYTTDFFQPSAYHADQQIISIYYRVVPLEKIIIDRNKPPFNFSEEALELYRQTGEIQTFRWIELPNFHSECLTLPIDKVVADIVQEKYG